MTTSAQEPGLQGLGFRGLELHVTVLFNVARLLWRGMGLGWLLPTVDLALALCQQMQMR